jgi:hypothetical protein
MSFNNHFKKLVWSTRIGRIVPIWIHNSGPPSYWKQGWRILYSGVQTCAGYYGPISAKGPTLANQEPRNNTYLFENPSVMGYIDKSGRWNWSVLQRVHTLWTRRTWGKSWIFCKYQRQSSNPFTRNWRWEYSMSIRIFSNSCLVPDLVGVQLGQGLPQKPNRPPMLSSPLIHTFDTSRPDKYKSRRKESNDI